MSNSPLVVYKRISPNKTSPRNHAIDTITIHCMAGQCSIEVCGEIFSTVKRQASSNYGIGPDGRIGMYVEEKDRAWTSSNRDNDMRAITIEVASDKFAPYAVTSEAFDSLIELVADICERNNIKELKWRADPSLIGQIDKQNMTAHKWFSDTACPGEYLYSRFGQIAELVNKKLKKGDLTDKFKIGAQYRILKDRTVRTGPGFRFHKKNHNELNPVAQKKDPNGDGKLDAGYKVTCKALKQVGKNTVWMKCPAGWIKVLKKDKEFVEEVVKK